jgi:hypothetical protein
MKTTMGITGLWKASHSFIASIWTLGLIAYQQIFAPIANETSFHQLAVTEGFTANVGGVHVLYVGVDARCLISLFFFYGHLETDGCCSSWIFWASYHHRHTKNPELVTLFVWCSRLFQLPVAPLFIFDGNHQPKNKRGKCVHGNQHWITHGMKEMLEGFGFAWRDVCIFLSKGFLFQS